MSRNNCVDEQIAWKLLVQMAALAKSGDRPDERGGIRLDSNGSLERTAADDDAWVRFDTDAGVTRFEVSRHVSAAARQLLELYVPLCMKADGDVLVLGHVSQSLDGQIATATGASRYVSGHEDLVHMHRLRALSDAVIVGASTVERDDPQLTTRLVPGTCPVRVIIDPRLRLSSACRVFSDGSAPTLVVHAEGAAPRDDRVRADLLPILADNGALPPRRIVAALHRLGLRRLFVEGGGVTLSRFLASEALHRIHVTISPLFIGQGRPGVVLPPIERLEQAIRPRVRRFALGDDVLFDCELDPPKILAD